MDTPLSLPGAVVVDELEVEGMDHGIAHSDVIEGGAATIHHKPCYAAGLAVRDFRLANAALLHRREIIAHRPAFGIELAHKTDSTGFEGLKQGISIPKELDADSVEISRSLAERQVLPPVVRIARQNHGFPRHVGLDRIGRRADRKIIQRAVGKVIRIGILRLFHNRAQSGNQHQLAVGLGEGQAQFAGADSLDPGDFLP